MPSMWTPDRDESTLALMNEDEDNDELALFIAENDTESSVRTDSCPLRICGRVSNKCSQLPFTPRCLGVILSVFVLIVTTVTCVGLGIASMMPLPVVDISVEAFNIPNHIAYKRYDSFTLALKHNTSYHGRSKRDVSADKDALMKKHAHTSPESAQSRFHLPDLDYLKFKTFKDFREKDIDALASKMDEDFRKSRVKRYLHFGCVFKYQIYPRWKMQVIFLAKGDGDENIFTKERLETVHRVEKKITSHPHYRNFCLKDYSLGQRDPAVKAQGNCAPLNSLLTYFYPSRDKHGRVFYDGLGNTLDKIESALKLAMNQESFYFYVDEKINKTFRQSKLLRTEVMFGSPLEGYCSTHVAKNQQSVFKKFIISYIDLLDKVSTDKVQVLYGGNELFDYEVDSTFWADVRMAYFTLGFIILFMFILTSFSLWLTFWGMLSIILSFPVALFFYRFIFHIDALGILNGAAAFVIIGIGVDDVFVFVNIFRQASHLHVPSARVLYTIKTAGKATFFTSFTTAAAFAANIASSIPAVYEFGVFMSLIVSSCWLTVVLMMPAALYIWSLCFSSCEASCLKLMTCRFKKRVESPIDAHEIHTDESDIQDAGDDDGDVPMLNIDNTVNSIADDDTDVPLLIPDPYSAQGSRAASAANSKDSFNIGKVFQLLIGRYLARFIMKARWVIIGLFSALLIISIGLMSQLRPATHPPQLFQPDTNLQQLLDLKANFTLIQSLSCYKCSGLYKVKSDKQTTPRPPVTTPAAPVTPVPQQPKTTAYKSISHTTLNPHISPAWVTTRTQAVSTHLPTSSSAVRKTTQTAAPTTRFATSRPNTTRPTAATRKPYEPPEIPHVATTTQKPGSVSKDFNVCEGNSCNNVKDRPNLRTGTKVFVVFGIKGIDRSGVEKGHVLNEYEGYTMFDPEFSRKSLNLDVLKDLCKVCKLIAANEELVKKGSAMCVPPVIPKQLLILLKNVPECKNLPDAKNRGSFNLQNPISAVGGMTKNNTLLWLAFAFESTTSEGQSYFTAYHQYQKWESFLEHIKKTELSPDSPLRDMFQTSSFWKKVMMEVVAVSSAIYGLALSMLVCVVSIAIFTGHIGLLFIVMVTITAMICLVVAIFYVAGWEMGAVEAISLSILVGSSVDYCVHLVEGYLIAFKHVPNNAGMKNSSLRQWRTHYALRHIGVAIISSAITTIIAAIPLTQTIIRPFSKFGDIVLINTSVSIIFTLLLCSSLLSTIAPAKFKSSLKSSGIAFFITAVVVGVLTLILFIISRTAFDIPGPGGEPLFPK